jgi:hypothetical protein
MIINVNDKKIPLYENDTSQSFLERVAASFDTLPYFVSFIDFDEILKNPKKKIEISLLIEDIKKDDSISFKDFLENNDVRRNFKDVKMDTLVRLWTSFHPILEDNEVYFIQPEAEFEELGVKLDISKFLSDTKKDFVKDIEQQIKKNSKKSKEFLQISKKIEELEPLDFIDFRKEKSVLSIKTNISQSNFSISTVFAKLLCTDDAPFASFSNIYKINQNFSTTIPVSWNISLENIILLKIFNKDNTDTIFSEDNYSECIIIFQDGNLYLNVNIDYSQKISKNLIKNRLFSCFTDFEDFEELSEEEESIAGVVLFPNNKFEKFVMSDIIMNNNLFSTFMAVDESKQASKKKSGLYLHFFLGNNEGTFSIISKKAEKADQELKNVDRKLIPIGSDFIRLRIGKVKNMQIAENFIKIFAKLLNIYYEEYKNVVKFYKNYIKNFAKEEEVEKEVQKVFTLREIAPDLFLPNYTRRCINPPRIIEDEEVGDYEETQVMKFPKTPEEGTQYNYVCDEKPYIYVGLRVNNLENKNKYKYIPCCFKKDQMGKNTSPYKEYYLGQSEKKGDQQNILVTSKLAPVDEFAILPENLNDLFFNIDDSFTYLRKGVNDTKQSFLECVLEGALKDFGTYNKKRKLAKLETEYKNITNYDKLIVASQENPGESPQQMKEILSDKEQYLDPRKWIRLLEVVYNCKIYLFSRGKDEKNAIFETPNHKSCYLRYKSKPLNTIFIYEHYGNETDSSTYPHCELIVKWDKSYQPSDKDAIQYSFIGKIPKEFEKFENKIIKQYYYNKYSIESITKFTIPSIFKLKSQFVDNYGKTRAIETQEGIILLTEPIPPLNIPEFSGDYNDLFKPTDVKKVMNFIKKYNLTVTSQGIYENTLKEININYENITLTFKVFSDISDPNIPNIPQKYPDFNLSILQHNNLKRTAYILTEYFIYYFSTQVSDSEQITLQNIKNFVRNFVSIENSEYKIPTSPFVSLKIMKDNEYINDEDKFIVKDEEVLKRLVYSLRLRISNNYESVKNYYLQTEILNFYDDIQYFTQSNNIILKNTNVFQIIDNNVYNRIEPSKEKYFFRNKLVLGDKITFLVKSENKEEAENISKNWEVDKKIDTAKNDEETNTKIYLYFSNKNIKTKNIRKNLENTTNILAYKYNDKVEYTAVAQL